MRETALAVIAATKKHASLPLLLEEASPVVAGPGDAPAGATAQVDWPGTADLPTDRPDEVATARMFVLAAIAGLAFWILLVVVVI